MVHRGITLRVHPGSKAKHDKMMRVAGACRKVWNEVLEICERQYQDYKAGKSDKPNVTYFGLNSLYVQSKREWPWWGELPAATVRSTMQHLAEAYKRFFDSAGFPDWQRRFKDTPKFTVPDKIKIKGTKLYIPKMGWVRLTGKNPYANHGVALQQRYAASMAVSMRNLVMVQCPVGFGSVWKLVGLRCHALS